MVVAIAAAALLGACGQGARPHAASGGERAAVTRSGTSAAVSPWAFEDRTALLVTTPSHRVHTTIADERRAAELAAFVEDWISVYRSAGGLSADLPSPPRTLDTFVFADRGEWERFTRRTLSEQAAPLLVIRRGGYAWAGQTVVYELSPPRDTLMLLAHEGWHQYTQATFVQRLPMWLEEGLATVMEGHRWVSARGTARPEFVPWANPERFDELREVVLRGGLWSVERLFAAGPVSGGAAGGDDEALGYYAQVWAMTQFLREGAGGKYRERLGEVVAEAAAGRLDQRVVAALGGQRATALMRASMGEAVAQTFFETDLRRLESEYRAFVSEVTRPGARDAIVAGQSPILTQFGTTKDDSTRRAAD